MKKLIIAPHIDDEVLGCGGILDKDSFVLHCGIEDRTTISSETRIAEIKKVQKIAKFDMKLLRGNIVNNYKVVDLIGEFEKAIKKVRPQQIYIPYPSYNQDHRAVFDAALVATRQHDTNFFVKKVLIYEQPHVFLWSHNGRKDFKPNYFVPIDINKKLKLYSLLKSQIRSFRSKDSIKALASLRGSQAQCKYAEAFQILRWVD